MDYWIMAQPSTPLPALEGSGDSETDLELVDDHGLLCMQEGGAADNDDDDDAESCSCESYGKAQMEYGSDDGVESDGDDDAAHGVDHEMGLFVWWPANEREKKEDKEVKVVDSEDDDRLFWETCLATGY
ncbi:putative phosphopantothenoylcysteine decarboxylase subunit VHS3 [Cocos nucifera]|uniref:Putative phosphopantothenoylcysteine decarboxylase subunit VHS3 n=1 Tax=Cocos nucifera TaxID=13894 RepID=A0A8K0I5Y5_COCNU|nr:putative phosphopantothenoylcysteine decarboxylase subunit VHS3 [Cocos nucifera]